MPEIRIPRLAERVVEIDGASFTVAPETYGDFCAALEFVRRNDLREDVAGYTGAAYLTARRIRAWTGVVLEDGTEAPCTEANKLALFGAHPQLLNRIAEECARQEAEDRKNSKPTQAT